MERRFWCQTESKLFLLLSLYILIVRLTYEFCPHVLNTRFQSKIHKFWRALELHEVRTVLGFPLSQGYISAKHTSQGFPNLVIEYDINIQQDSWLGRHL